uniref:Uncharacterized protein n=1 Tax=Salvator merianae TaxID=96440 RepID=A0A8D0C7K1_SALMN
LSSVFKACHDAVDPTHYYEACNFDSCRVPGSSMECASLQNYAATCADQGVCIDWRNHTNASCPVACPSNKVYMACGPSEEQTCNVISVDSTKQIEGCFCPSGTTLYDSGVDVCVKTCGCVGPDNIPRKYGEQFQFDCKDCVCREGGVNIICEPHKCQTPDHEDKCEGEGFYKITEVNPEDSCCSKTTCVCNSTDCTSKPPRCKAGFEAVAETPEGQCCPVYQCSKSNHSLWRDPGSPVLGKKCQECVCTDQRDDITSPFNVDCKPVKCDVTCEAGYDLIAQAGECCGKCVQTHCIINAEGNQSLILRPGEQRNPPNDKCTIYSCVKINRQLISSKSSITCPLFNEDKCLPDTIAFLPNGCCKTCKSCKSSSLYSVEANTVEHKCICCRESKTSMRETTLVCPDGTKRTHKYLHVDSCECLTTECRPQSPAPIPRRNSNHSISKM